MADSLYYGDESISLKDTTDIEGLTSAIEAAAQAGGGWVTIDGASRQVSIFVTAGQYIRITAPRRSGGRVW